MDEVTSLLTTEKLGRKLLSLESVDSTNQYAKKHAEELQDGTVIIALEQTSGRGRMGREWFSPANKGVFMTIILKPPLSTNELSPINQIAAAAVIKAFQIYEIDAKIKWPNDILLSGRKVCGILTESGIEKGKVRFVVVGIGINNGLTEKDIPADLQDCATSLYLETGKAISSQGLAAEVINAFETLYNNYIYRKDQSAVQKIVRENSAVIGRKVKLSRSLSLTDWQEVYVQDVKEDGSLLVTDEQGKNLRIISGEISLRLLD